LSLNRDCLTANSELMRVPSQLAGAVNRDKANLIGISRSAAPRSQSDAPLDGACTFDGWRCVGLLFLNGVDLGIVHSGTLDYIEKKGIREQSEEAVQLLHQKGRVRFRRGCRQDPIETDGCGHIWHSVSGITPSRDRTLDEVKDVVEEHSREDEIASSLLSRRRWSLKYG
jgi:hypothetical protein